MRQLKRQFRPEFLNRLDDIVLFHPLTHTNLKQIVRVQLQTVQKRLREQKAIDLQVDDSAVEMIGNIAYDPVMVLVLFVDIWSVTL